MIESSAPMQLLATTAVYFVSSRRRHTIYWRDWSSDVCSSDLVAGLIAAVFAAVVGSILMRTRGHSFVILTIAFLFVMQLVTLNWSGLTNGNHGLTLPLPRWDRDYYYWPFYYAFFGLMLMSIAVSWWIRRTKFGMGLIAIREDE